MRTPETEEYVLNKFQEKHSTSTRAVAAEISVSPSKLGRVLREEQI